ncbi:MAG: Xaa-Pro peptidase family protein [Pseudomonadota bacterium]
MALHFTDNEFQRRSALLTAAMKERNLDAMLLFAQESMYWLTGFDTFGFVFFQCLVVTKDGSTSLITRSADLRQAKHTSNIKDVLVWTDRAGADPTLPLKDHLSGLDLVGARLGVEYDTQGLTARNGQRLDERLRNFAKLEDASDIIPRLRAVKSAEEIVYVRQAAKLADDALRAGLAETKVGADEGVILAAMQGAIFAGGGDYPGNEFIISSGEDALLCRYKAGRRNLDDDDQLTLEWAGTYRHYHVAMMETVVVGTPRPHHEAMFEAVDAALEAVKAVMRPGHTFGNVFDAHANTLGDHGMSAHRLNACGYSLGAAFTPSWMEWPMFYNGNPAPIEPDMVLFAHMILMDSETSTAMCLGRTYLTTTGEPEPLSAIAPKFLTR